MTPHIEAKLEDIASTVIMPGDPLRAKYISEHYLSRAKCVNTVRGMLAYTGYYKDKRVTVMASGMGNASIGIYSYELFHVYDVKNIIRIGTCGAYDPSLDLYDVILVTESYSKSSYARVQNGTEDHLMFSTPVLNEKLIHTADRMHIPLHMGRIYNSDVFYTEDSIWEEMRDRYHCLGVEMETFALFSNAKITGKNAACILTVSDSFVSKTETTSKERETSLTTMIELVLESIV